MKQRQGAGLRYAILFWYLQRKPARGALGFSRTNNLYY
jgi:hypothetical protein